MRSAVAGKPRVHELAKEFGVESKTVLAKLQEIGEYVKSASSTVEAPVARRLREAMNASSAPVTAAPVATGDAPKVSAKPAPPTKAAPRRVPGPPPPAAKPASAHDIEVAAAEMRATALKAEQDATVKAAQAAKAAAPATPTLPRPGPAVVPSRPVPGATPRPGTPGAPPAPGAPGAPGGGPRPGARPSGPR